eukprot:scaffold12.g7982.t1
MQMAWICWAPRERHSPRSKSEDDERVIRASRTDSPVTRRQRKPKNKTMLARLVSAKLSNLGAEWGALAPRNATWQACWGITGVFDDHQEESGSEASGSPRAPRLPPAARQDSGHLTSGSTSRRSTSATGELGVSLGFLDLDQRQQQAAAGQSPRSPPRSPRVPRRQASQQRQQHEEGGGEGTGGGWGGLLGGAQLLPGIPFLTSLLSRGSTEEEGEGEEDADAAAERRDAQIAAARAQEAARAGSSHYPTLALGGAGGAPEGEAAAAAAAALRGTTTPHAPLAAAPGGAPPPASAPSALVPPEQMAALAAAVPARYRHSHWSLVYSSGRDGISMQTLLRNARGRAPTVLVVRDLRRHVFGSYCSEAWRLDKRYFGTGESFVFRLAPGPPVAWFWWWRRMALGRNDFFQWGSPEGIAVGGAGGYALWLDCDLARGVSRNSTTFGNDSLASAEEFAVGHVELWGLD